MLAKSGVDKSSTSPPFLAFVARDPKRQNAHIGLDGEVMQALVAYSEEGNQFEDQNEVPNFIRDMIYKKDLDNLRRKDDSRKRKGRGSSPSYPILINNMWPGSSEQTLALASSTGGPHKDAWRVPEPRDGAIMRYCTWHCARLILVLNFLHNQPSMSEVTSRTGFSRANSLDTKP
ncbi:uncharacterized protein B0I36DRAFT_354214 [Microdochium trichocladiopsis]|uniref:Uncharacterized protein n=1 Tax=Microdochium trichocladiopsis TaxID=1682393 RepID=A0A9P8XZV0_9PEZI|nr:uncharacterized protein B0I36DRAFT_354214 [Microdochium trichocladiopsis]KAH7021579.1 hypothetical protein B0I36DRAFT_354214 [Microdochium trichocladiopsis]